MVIRKLLDWSGYPRRFYKEKIFGKFESTINRFRYYFIDKFHPYNKLQGLKLIYYSLTYFQPPNSLLYVQPALRKSVQIPNQHLHFQKSILNSKKLKILKNPTLRVSFIFIYPDAPDLFMTLNPQ